MNENVGQPQAQNSDTDTTKDAANSLGPEQHQGNRTESNTAGNEASRHPQKPNLFRWMLAWSKVKFGGHRPLEWLTLGFEVLTFLALCVYTYYAGGQWSVMRGTLDEMKRSGQQSTDQAWRAIDNINWLARSMDGSVKQAQSALDASIKASRNDQRAWVTLRKMDATPNFSEMVIPIINSGKTPALDLHLFAQLGWGRKEIEPVFSYDESQAFGRAVLAPGADYSMTSKEGNNIPKADLDAILAGTSRLFVFGSIWYKDIFGIPHETKFCGMYDAKTKLMSGYPKHNSAN